MSAEEKSKLQDSNKSWRSKYLRCAHETFSMSVHKMSECDNYIFMNMLGCGSARMHLAGHIGLQLHNQKKP